MADNKQEMWTQDTQRRLNATAQTHPFPSGSMIKTWHDEFLRLTTGYAPFDEYWNQVVEKVASVLVTVCALEALQTRLNARNNGVQWKSHLLKPYHERLQNAFKESDFTHAHTTPPHHTTPHHTPHTTHHTTPHQLFSIVSSQSAFPILRVSS